MATPTPSSNTPQKHLPAFSSPAPRSVPGMVNFDSPAALGLLAEGGVGMGISMSGLGMSSLGLSASAMGRADEDERRRRLETIISTLKSKRGRVTEQGIKDLCKKEGLEVMADPGSLFLAIGSEGAVEILVRNGEILADSVNLELTHDRHNYAASGSRILANSLKPLPGIAKINLSLDRFSHNLDKLLRMDKLSASGNGGVSCYSAIFGVYASLRKLFEHEKKMALAVMDANSPDSRLKAEREVLCKKSGRPRINAGDCLGLSLEYWMEKRSVNTRTAAATTSVKGKEKMDVDSESTDEYPEDKDPDTNKVYSLTIECEASQSSMYSPIRISDAWISDAIEKPADAPDADMNNILLNRPSIDWLEPPPTYLPSAAADGDDDAMNLDNAPGRLPNIRFIAKFNPPLVIPLTTFVTIQQSFGVSVEGLDIRPTTFAGLVLRPDEADPVLGPNNQATQELLASTSDIIIDKDGKEVTTQHLHSLYVPREDWSRVIESLPFSHPRQLVEILPTLRQYAFTTSLLQHTFGTSSHTSNSKQRASHPTDLPSPPLTPDQQASTKTSAQKPLQLDLTLSSAPPMPRLRLDMPYPSPPPPPSLPAPTLPTTETAASDFLSSIFESSPAAPAPAKQSSINITVDINPNADIVVIEQNVISTAPLDREGKDGDADADVDMDKHDDSAMIDRNRKVNRIGRALDVAADIGVWAEWVRREVGRDLA
ncbi:hypothetical protein K491DRAFT_650213 [Lophiostoma macrostomum CBS 122681]|uniref:Mediator of RNA polymerase II transcription subunit 1 n=1 Tax=Lophiostoma macrostomum CBS 122681 TaxID=1314788 RepID=A0A6A6TMT5_9PLEO|nr:hypothetical protein K491DRAFT_650213 [Lophiostoma macrostomum CBS 122681]